MNKLKEKLETNKQMIVSEKVKLREVITKAIINGWIYVLMLEKWIRGISVGTRKLPFPVSHKAGF